MKKNGDNEDEYRSTLNKNFEIMKKNGDNEDEYRSIPCIKIEDDEYRRRVAIMNMNIEEEWRIEKYTLHKNNEEEWG
jgi:hypothetical protein